MTDDVPAASRPTPSEVCNSADFVLHLDRLRRRAAFGSQKARVGLDALTRSTRLPRSSVHAYLSGAVLPPADRLDLIIAALGGTATERREWADARDRVADQALLVRAQPGPGPDIVRLPSANARLRSARAVALAHLKGLAAAPPDPPNEGADGPVVIPAVVCATWVGSYVYRDRSAGATRTGFLFAGNSWFVGQAGGGPNPALSPGVRSTAWLYTQADVDHAGGGGWGWLPATALAGFAGGPVVPGIPVLVTTT